MRKICVASGASPTLILHSCSIGLYCTATRCLKDWPHTQAANGSGQPSKSGFIKEGLRFERESQPFNREANTMQRICISLATHRLIAVAALLFVLPAQAAVIYRWVDENGRTHVSDLVPERYKKSATRIDSSKSEVTPEQRQEAERAAAKEQALADEAARRRLNTQANQPAPAASQPVTAKRPAQGVTDSTDCETWQRLYKESMECFGPYRTTRGATKPEAFEKCNPVPSPEPKCGPVRE